MNRINILKYLTEILPEKDRLKLVRNEAEKCEEGPPDGPST